MTDYVIEKDTLGEVKVPADAYYGAQTVRARDNFPVSGRRVPVRVTRALGSIKWAAARANLDLRLLDPKLAQAIEQAADEVARGLLDDHFIVEVFQTGSGTSSNMNANEVIAKRANEILTGRRDAKKPVHPNDHVNLGQSSNDVFPTALHLAALGALHEELYPALAVLESDLARKAQEFADVVKVGRTHLQDAVPVTLGQEFAGYTSMIAGCRRLLAAVQPALEELPLGGTAVGTGINTHPEFPARAIAYLSERLGWPLKPMQNYFDGLGSRRALVALSGVLKTLACDLMKIANDLRLLSSGPRSGFAEITLPELQPGSSIMPGKINPVIPEAVCQVAAQVMGNDVAINIAGQSGLLELNVMKPLIAANLLDSIALVANVSRLFAEKCIRGIQARRERCAQLAEQSLSLATALVPRVGYDTAARIVRRAYLEHRTLREVALEETNLSAQEIAQLLDPRNQLAPSAERVGAGGG
ncbi:MAG: aspartate ammonia-lyase [Gemmataceae bacterium]|mgnify:CR=1 FL=1